MVVGSFTEEFSSPISRQRLWKAAIVDAHNLIPKIASDHVTSLSIVEGDGGVGTITELKFFDSSKDVKYVRSRIDVVDEENFVYKYSFVAGFMGDKYESFSFEIKFEESNNGGCICKTYAEYKTRGDHVPTEEEKTKGKEGFVGMFKGVEAYLLANPGAYA